MRVKIDNAHIQGFLFFLQIGELSLKVPESGFVAAAQNNGKQVHIQNFLHSKSQKTLSLLHANLLTENVSGIVELYFLGKCTREI